MKLPLIPVEDYLEEFPEHEDLSEHDLMTARIEHEHQVRLKLEERRQEKLKQKQKLIAEVKKGKEGPCYRVVFPFHGGTQDLIFGV
jgi:THO complex subunit 5